MINLFFSILSGILVGLSFNFPFFSYLVWFSLIPIFWTIEHSKTKYVFLYGVLFGFISALISLFWLGRVSILGLFFLVLYLSLYCGIYTLLGKFLLKKKFRIITLSFLWVILEFLKENIWCGFGWTNLGYTQYKNLYLIQIADIFGVKFISFIIVSVNVLFWEFLSFKRILFKKLIFIILLICFCIAYSFYSLNNLKFLDKISISLIQPNIPQKIKWEEEANLYILEKLKSLAKETSKNSLVIFPEASWPFVVEKNNLKELRDFILTIAKPTLIGVVLKEDNYFYNSAMLFERNGELKEIYRKIKLVPFGEYVPLRNIFKFIRVLNTIGDMERGKDLTTFFYRDKKFSILICFEDIFPPFVLKFSKERDFLVNITNDAWFGGNPQASQHLSIIVFRAIENRISIARCANTGISAIVSFSGKINKLEKNKKEVDFEGVFNSEIFLRKERSLYNKWGDLPFIGFALLFFIFLLKNELFVFF
ncbi:MAG: apolipoprotein N-acyltransferase [Candidatus Aenigmatarchaeota archaeon]